MYRLIPAIPDDIFPGADRRQDPDCTDNGLRHKTIPQWGVPGIEPRKIAFRWSFAYIFFCRLKILLTSAGITRVVRPALERCVRSTADQCMWSAMTKQYDPNSLD